MEDNVSKIKERVDIVDLVGSYVKLQKAGVNFKARCPFHNEKSGSFFVTPERQIWHCFGCGAGGDIFTFVQQIEGMEFPDALRLLASKAGIELNKLQSSQKNNKSVLYEICQRATQFFEKQLWESNAGQAVLIYLRDRGLTDETIRAFQLGYAPESWQALGDFLGRRYNPKDIFEAGLTIKKDRGGYYDRFRSRIMFPIFDANGQAVGFSGRVFMHPSRIAATKENLDEKNNFDVAKYVNTPQTAIYDKGRILYGLHKAKLDIRRANRCLAVEGNLDVILSHQAGVPHAVASCGTALTVEHLKTIRRYTDNLDLCFDMDSAGLAATDRCLPVALAAGFNIGIVSLDDAELKDPADFVKKHGTLWQERALMSKPFLEFYVSHARVTHDLSTALGKKQFSQKIFPLVASISNTVEKAHWLTEIALLLKLKEDIVRQEVEAAKPKPIDFKMDDELAGHSALPVYERLGLMEEGLLSLLVSKPVLLAKISTVEQGYLSGRTIELIGQLRKILEKSPTIEPKEAISQLIASSNRLLTMSLEFVYLKSQQLWQGFTDTDLDKELQGFLGNLKKRSITAKLEGLQYDIRSAERSNDKQRLSLLLAEFSQISKELAK